jgi:putative flavoprotein involved in K+ transport
MIQPTRGSPDSCTMSAALTAARFAPRRMSEWSVSGMGDMENIDTVIVGAGQSGLSAGYHLARRGVPFVILEANARVGDTWRNRWDSLRLFTPAAYDGLAGMPFPAPARSFPTKDAMADYLEVYAERFKLPVRTGVTVTRVSRRGAKFLVTTSESRIEADNVVIAMASYQHPRMPDFARQLDHAIVQLHSSEYRNCAQLADGPVLVVGAGNSGAEIAIEAARNGHPTWISGRETGHVPFRIDSVIGRYVLAPIVIRFVFHYVLTLKTPMGRRAHGAEGSMKGTPLIRTRPRELEAAGIQRLPRTTGVRDGKPLLDDGRVIDVANVVWCTGFHPGFSWVDLPVFGLAGAPVHNRGIVEKEPGLYFLGLHFLYAMSSTMIHGADRDAEYVANAIAASTRDRHVGIRGPQLDSSSIDAIVSPSRMPSTTSIPSTTSPKTV